MAPNGKPWLKAAPSGSAGDVLCFPHGSFRLSTSILGCSVGQIFSNPKKHSFRKEQTERYFSTH